MKKDPKSYIEELSSKSRIRKQIQQRDEKSSIKQREEGFSIYVRGANKERVTEQRFRQFREKSSDKSRPRKKWEAPVPGFVQSTRSRGEPHPDAYQESSEENSEEYSDSFEEDDSPSPPVESVRQTVDSLQDVVRDSKKKNILKKISQISGEKLDRLLRFVENIDNETSKHDRDDSLEEILEESFDTREQKILETQKIRKSIQKLDQILEGQNYERSLTNLEKIFGEDYSESTRTNPESTPFSSKPKPVIHKHKRPYSSKSSEVKKDTNELVLKVISTWGHAYLVGLTELELFDSDYSRITVPSNSVQIRNSGPGVFSRVERMLDGVKQTEDESHMWVGPLPAPPSCLEIVIHGLMPSGIRVWNYNKSLLESVKGIKDLEVTKNSEILWSGVVKRGSGNKTDEFYTNIPLEEDFDFQKADFYQEERKEVPVGKIPQPEPEQPSPHVFEPQESHFSPVQHKKKQFFEQPKLVPEPKQQLLEQPNLIPEPTLKMLGLNPKQNEQINESLNSLEFFKITNESRIKRERKQLPRIEERKKPVKPKQEFPMDPLEKFMAEQAAPKPQPVTTLRIPKLPVGQVITFNIISTWGDQHYVGLSGIEIFNERGTPVMFRNPKSQISADPPDVNILPGYGTDPRTVDNLLDGVNWTCDDLHVWLAPFTAGKSHSVTIKLLKPTSLSMIRIWNYNKSRIHSYRGVRDIEITLDDRQLIFKGEVTKAPGRMKDADQYCEYIMFTSEENVLKKIETNDWIKDFERNQVDEELMSTIMLANRPGTASKDQDFQSIGQDGRPMTAAIVEPPAHKASLRGRKLKIVILETWGDSFYVGLTGIQVFGSAGSFSLQKNQIEASPKDLNVIPGYSGDYRTLEKLINNRNATTDDHNMWLIPFAQGRFPFIEVDLGENRGITGIKFWNYNKSTEDTARGVKRILIYLDGKCMTSETGVLIRKAPGHSEYDFGQLVSLPFKEGWSEELTAPLKNPVFASMLVKQDYETPYLPTGFILKLKLYTTWGDMHYIGLNGIELYDQNGKNILQAGENSFSLHAYPQSVRELPGMEHDVRTPEKLLDGVNETSDDKHMWLAPFQNSACFYNPLGGGQKPNEIVVTFEKLVCLGFVKLYNYSKTTARGVREFELSLDDTCLYRGSLRQGKSPTAVLFTGNRQVVGRAAELVYRDASENSVVMYNERKLLGGMEPKRVTAARPTTSVLSR